MVLKYRITYSEIYEINGGTIESIKVTNIRFFIFNIARKNMQACSIVLTFIFIQTDYVYIIQFRDNTLIFMNFV